MKKIVALVLMLTILFSLVGCFEENYPEKEVMNTQEIEEKKEVEEQNEEKTFSLNETAVFEKMKITAEEVKETVGEGFLTAEEGKTFVGIKFSIENISNEDITVSSLLLFDAYVDDVKANLSFTATTAFSEGLLDGTIAGGKKLVGWYPLEVPADWKSIELDVKSDWLSNMKARFVFDK